MSIALKNAIKIVTDAVAVINGRFPIKWEDVSNKPDIPSIDTYYTKQEVIDLIQKSNQLTAPNGSIWEASIDNNGKITWKKVNGNGTR